MKHFCYFGGSKHVRDALEVVFHRREADFSLASSALAMLTRLLRYGQICHHGALFNAELGRSVPLPIDPEAWMKQRPRQTRVAKAA